MIFSILCTSTIQTKVMKIITDTSEFTQKNKNSFQNKKEYVRLKTLKI